MRSIRKTRNFRKRNIRKSKKNNRKSKRINRKVGGSVSRRLDGCPQAPYTPPRGRWPQAPSTPPRGSRASPQLDDCRHFLLPSSYNIKAQYCNPISGYTVPLGKKCIERAKRNRPQGYTIRGINLIGDNWCKDYRKQHKQLSGTMRQAQQLRARRMAEQATRARTRTRTRIPVSGKNSINNIDFDDFSYAANNFINRF